MGAGPPRPAPARERRRLGKRVLQRLLPAVGRGTGCVQDRDTEIGGWVYSAATRWRSCSRSYPVWTEACTPLDPQVRIGHAQAGVSTDKRTLDCCERYDRVGGCRSGGDRCRRLSAYSGFRPPRDHGGQGRLGGNGMERFSHARAQENSSACRHRSRQPSSGEWNGEGVKVVGAHRGMGGT